jgi:hypothetical protein
MASIDQREYCRRMILRTRIQHREVQKSIEMAQAVIEHSLQVLEQSYQIISLAIPPPSSETASDVIDQS